MLDPVRARVFSAAFVATFVLIRGWLWFAPNTDLDVVGYNVHHLFTGVLLLTVSMLPLALGLAPRRPATLLTAAAGVGLSLVLDEWLYLLATDGANASYWLPVSVWGAVALHALVVGVVFALSPRR